MSYSDKPKNEWDDLDLYDREAADIRRALDKIDLNQWVKDLYDLDRDLFDKLYTNFNKVKSNKY